MGNPIEQQADSPFHANQGPWERNKLVRKVAMRFTPGRYFSLHLTVTSISRSGHPSVVSFMWKHLENVIFRSACLRLPS